MSMCELVKLGRVILEFASEFTKSNVLPKDKLLIALHYFPFDELDLVVQNGDHLHGYNTDEVKVPYLTYTVVYF